jgi:hypothetical protein
MSASGVWDWSGESFGIGEERIPQRAENLNRREHRARRENETLCALCGAETRFQPNVCLVGYAGLFYVGKEKFAEGGGGQSAFDVGVVKIGAGKRSELLGDAFVLAAGEGWSWRGTKTLAAMLGQEVESFDGIDEGKRRLVFEVFTGYVEQLR